MEDRKKVERRGRNGKREMRGIQRKNEYEREIIKDGKNIRLS